MNTDLARIAANEANRGKTPGKVDLTRYAWLSIFTAIGAISLKFFAWYLTGSVGLLSDASESIVNLAAAIVALWALKQAAKPADERHHFGRAKAEFFSAAFEGQLIFLAALVIVFSAIDRLQNPVALESIDTGVLISFGASLLNAATAGILFRAGRAHRSPTLIADAKHLVTDLWTSLGVIVGMGLVMLTGWTVLDPIIALLVGVNIVIAGMRILRESTIGLLDGTLSPEENAAIAASLAQFTSEEVTIHALRTRAAGQQRFASMHVLVPGNWTVARGHDLVHDIEEKLEAEHKGLSVETHLENAQDPRAYDDYVIEVKIPAKKT